MHNGVESMLKTLYPEIFEILCKTILNAKDLIEQPDKENLHIWNRTCPFQACSDHGVRTIKRRLLEHLGVDHFREHISKKFLKITEENTDAIQKTNQCKDCDFWDKYETNFILHCVKKHDALKVIMGEIIYRKFLNNCIVSDD